MKIALKIQLPTGRLINVYISEKRDVTYICSYRDFIIVTQLTFIDSVNNLFFLRQI